MTNNNPNMIARLIIATLSDDLAERLADNDTTPDELITSILETNDAEYDLCDLTTELDDDDFLTLAGDMTITNDDSPLHNLIHELQLLIPYTNRNALLSAYDARYC